MSTTKAAEKDVLSYQIVFATSINFRARRPFSPISRGTRVCACATSISCTTSSLRLHALVFCVGRKNHHRNNHGNFEDNMQERIHLMTALAPACAHALHITCVSDDARVASWFETLDFLPSKPPIVAFPTFVQRHAELVMS